MSQPMNDSRGRSSPDAMRDMTPSDIGRRLLRIFAQHQRGSVLADFARSIGDTYPPHEREEMALLNMEGLAWLVRQGLLVQDPAQMVSGSTWYKLSREGRSYIVASRQPAEIVLDSAAGTLLHPRIALNAGPTFERGPDAHAEAIVMAFMQVETATRERIRLVTGVESKKVGRDIFIEAFKYPGGPLLPDGIESGEAFAIRDFFGGSYGAFRNPHSHGFVRFENDEEVVRLLVIASQQLYLLERLPEPTSA